MRVNALLGAAVALVVFGAFAFGAFLATAIPAQARPAAVPYDSQSASVTMASPTIHATVTVSGPRKAVQFVINYYEGSHEGWVPSVYQAPILICVKQHQYGTSIDIRDTSRDPKSWGELACGK